MSMARRLTVFLFSCHRLMQFYLNPHLQGNRFPSITFVTQVLGFPFTSVFPTSVIWLYFILIMNNVKYVEQGWTSTRHTLKTSFHRSIGSQTVIISSFYQLVNRYRSIFEPSKCHDIIFFASLLFYSRWIGIMLNYCVNIILFFYTE